MKQKLFILSLILIFSCGEKTSETESLDITKTEIELIENLKPQTPIKSFTVLKDGSYVVISTSKDIVVYSKDGKQIKIDSNRGKGPVEIYSPNKVRPFNDGFVIWDNVLMKMVEFNQNAEPVQEILGFEYAVDDFMVDEKHIYIYKSALVGNPFIQILEKQTLKLIKEFGYTENMQLLTNMHECGGGLSIFQNLLYYIPSSRLELSKVTLNDYNETKNNLDLYKIIPFKNYDENIENLINSNKIKAIELALSSSIVTGIHLGEGKIAITGETGDSTNEGSYFNTNKRKNFIIFLDHDMNYIGTHFENFNSGTSCWVQGQNQLARIIQKEGKEDFTYFIQTISLE